MSLHLVLVAGSALVAAIQLTSSFLLMRKNRAGWVVSVACNLVACPFDFYTAQYGFALVSVLNMGLAVRAWHTWKVME